MKAILLIALASASAQPLPTQFDLVCEGQFQIGLKRPEAYSFRYVVDLTRMQWCKNAEALARCPMVHPLARVDEARYTFRESALGEPQVSDYVDRQTGESFAYDRRLGIKEIGTCRLAEFSGFPAPKL